MVKTYRDSRVVHNLHVLQSGCCDSPSLECHSRVCAEYLAGVVEGNQVLVAGWVGYLFP